MQLQTAAEVPARLIRVATGPRYLSRWLRARDITPQRPRRVPRERDEQAIAGWLARDWPRIKKRPAGAGHTSL